MKIDDINNKIFQCQLCSRLVEWREKVSAEKRTAYRSWDYWGKPVPGFGDLKARVFVVGLAPGAHGSNRTGRQFTGDASGDFLFSALYRAGFASQPRSIARVDGLNLNNLYTAPVCRCVPPGNKPTNGEIRNCLPYLVDEINLIKPKILVALGRIAFEYCWKIKCPKERLPVFRHNEAYPLLHDEYLVCSYHPSRQNTQTGRLTEEMFDLVWEKVKLLLDNG